MKLRPTLAALLLTLTAGAAVAPLDGIDPAGVDPAIRPQDDLYRATNGRWLANTPIPADLANIGAFSLLAEKALDDQRAMLEEVAALGAQAPADERKAADLYRSFLDTVTIEARGLAPLRPELARIAALRTRNDLVAYLGRAQRLGVPTPLRWSVDQDARDAGRYVMGLEQSGLSMPDRDYYLREDAAYQNYRARQLEYIAQLLAVAGVPGAEEQAARVQALEKAIAQAHWTRVQNRDPVATYNRMSLAQLRAAAPQIEWPLFFAALGAPAGPVVVAQPSYLAALGRLLQDTPVADWQAYLRFHLLDDAAAALGARFDQLQFGFHQSVLAGVREQRPRWKRAIGLVDRLVGEISGRMYVARHFSPDSKQRMQALVGNLLDAYGQGIDTLDWMGPATRAEARRKLASFGVKVGYPDQWRDYSALLIRADDLYGNLQRATEFEHRRALAKIGKAVDRGEWHMTTPTVNAYYNPTMNEIVFPAAILQPPFFDPAADDAVNYGAIGAVIGHEISHGFDDSGRQFDGTGNLRDWWSEADANRFKARAVALVQQYAACRVLDNQPINGELTLGENIADLSGLAMAYRAWQLSLDGRPAPLINGRTGAQRFFFGWAQVWRRNYRDDNLRARLSTDPHSPSEFRANVPPSNIEAFYEAFGLQPGDKLYRRPEDRVRIW